MPEASLKDKHASEASLRMIRGAASSPQCAGTVLHNPWLTYMVLFAASRHILKHALLIPEASLIDKHALEARFKTASCCMQANSQGQVFGALLKYRGTTHQNM